MRSTTTPRNEAALLVASLILLLSVAGCSQIPNQFRETGPSVMADWNTPTANDVKEHYQPAPPEKRDWQPLTLSAQSGAVTHWPLWFEDPFVDKGAGRTDETCPRNVYRMGWEDFVAAPYGLSRYTVNWLFLPVSMVVTPPWTVMVSDGDLSRQCLGYDHDAARLSQKKAEAPEVHGELVPLQTLKPAPEWKKYCPPPAEPPVPEPEKLGD